MAAAWRACTTQAEPSWMNWGGQREGQQRLGYAERGESSRAVHQPQEEIAAYEHP